MVTQSESSTVALRLSHLTKSFGGVAAVVDVSFDLRAGEVVALAGENGAGKSTVKNLISGALRPDSGEVTVFGNVAEEGVSARMGQGIATIHQEVSLLPDLTVGENVMFNRLGMGSHWRFSPSKVSHAAQPYLDRVGAQFGPGCLVSDLSTGETQLVEIAKSLVTDPRVIVFDEPTSSLTMAEREKVFAVVRSLRDNGVAVLYISHFLEEIFDLSARVVVMRDGKVVAEEKTSDLDRSTLEALMVGRELAKGYPEVAPTSNSVALSVSGLGDTAKVSDVSFDVRHGEVFGLAGLMGAGRTEVARAIFGLSRRRGTVTVDGVELRPGNPRAAIGAGVAFVTEDRRDEGLYLERPILESLSVVRLPSLTRVRPLGLINRRAEHDECTEQAERLRLTARGGLGALGGSLSGGNQQKVVLGKWLVTQPRVLILDEPTRGIDVGAKAEIYRIFTQLAADGAAVLFISSEMEELMGLCHRIGVMHEGHLQGILQRSQFDQTTIIRLATGGVA